MPTSQTGPQAVVPLPALGASAHAASFPLTLDGTTAATVCSLEMLAGQQFGALAMIFVDNTDNSQAPAYVTFLDTGAKMEVPAGSALWLLAVTGQKQFQLASAVSSTTAIRCIALDVAIQPTGVQPVTGDVTVNAGTVDVGSVTLNPGTNDIGNVGIAGTPDVAVTGTAAVAVTGTADVSVANSPLVGTLGTFGTDYSANAPAVTGTVLATVPANILRNFVGVQNQSAGALQIVRDDGNNNNTTVLILNPAGAAGAEGPSWSSATFKGRVRVYGAAGSQVAVWTD